MTFWQGLIALAVILAFVIIIIKAIDRKKHGAATAWFMQFAPSNLIEKPKIIPIREGSQQIWNEKRIAI